MSGLRGVPGRERYYELDLARFLAAFAVLMFHYTFRATAADGYTELSFPRFGPFWRYGYLGVDFFFIISGFVILLTASTKSPKDFVISRMVRLYPNYWVGCLLTFLVLLAVDPPQFPVAVGQFLVNLTMLQTFVGVSHIDSVYWSLVVELKFYLLTFVVLALGLLRFIPWVLAGWWTISVVLTHFVRLPYADYFLIPEWSSYFIAGCVFFLVRRDGFRPWHGALLLGCLYLAVFRALDVRLDLIEHFHHEFSPIAIAGHIALFFVFFGLFSTRRTRIIASPRWVALGALTYPLYLVHQRVGYVLIQALQSHWPRFLVLTFVTVCMLALAWAIHRSVEVPFSPVFRRGLERISRRLPHGTRP